MNLDEPLCESELYKSLVAFARKVFAYLGIDSEYPFIMQGDFLMAVRMLNGRQSTYRFSKEPFGFVGERYLIDCFIAEHLDGSWQIILMESVGRSHMKDFNRLKAKAVRFFLERKIDPNIYEYEKFDFAIHVSLKNEKGEKVYKYSFYEDGKIVSFDENEENVEEGV